MLEMRRAMRRRKPRSTPVEGPIRDWLGLALAREEAEFDVGARGGEEASDLLAQEGEGGGVEQSVIFYYVAHTVIFSHASLHQNYC